MIGVDSLSAVLFEIGVSQHAKLLATSEIELKNSAKDKTKGFGIYFMA